MSDLPPPPAAAPPPPPPSPGAPSQLCYHCGAPITPDQDWCLNCGAAVTTAIAGASGWRTPIVIVAVVLLLAAAALVFAFVELSGEADKSVDGSTQTATGPSGVTGPTGPIGLPTGPSGLTGLTGPTGSIPTPSVTTTPPTGADIGRWPDGKTAYTVILFSEQSFSAAKSKAQTVPSLPDVGILESSKYSTLRGGYFVVFSGQYDTQGAAQKAAKSAASQAPGAYPKQVKPK
jgi:hypothetical protein